MPSPAKRLAFGGVMIALAAIFSYVENLFPISLGVPGVKLGLANVVTLFALYVFGLPAAAAVSLLRVTLVSFMFGNPAASLYSLAGAIASLLTMAALKKSGRFSILGVSMAGGVIHPAAQLLVAIAISGTPSLAHYLPVLIVTGLIAGFLMGLAAHETIRRIAPAWQGEGQDMTLTGRKEKTDER